MPREEADATGQLAQAHQAQEGAVLGILLDADESGEPAGRQDLREAQPDAEPSEAFRQPLVRCMVLISSMRARTCASSGPGLVRSSAARQVIALVNVMLCPPLLVPSRRLGRLRNARRP
jgi:hypothetical protein